MVRPSKPGIRILVVDDEPDLRTLYELTLLREGYVVDTAEAVGPAWQCLEHSHFDLVITDMRLPDGLGLTLLKRLAAQHRSERVIVITAYGSAENAVESLKVGAFDYLTKPVDLKQFRSVVAAAVQDLPAKPTEMRAPTPSPPASKPPPSSALQRLVGSSRAMQLVKERIVKVAGSMAPVLINGESGTGKELVARALHECSHRASKPFVAVNCGAIPENLLEAEFFGAKKGSYTGSTQDRDGYFQAARGGTLFLDEIGDLPLSMQTKLLRAIQERRIRPIGSTQEDVVDVRIISATHKNLVQEVQAQAFRQDLFYRLNVIDIRVPALRERLEDLPELCAALMGRIAQESGQVLPALSPDVVENLAGLQLNGNVRELENLLHRAVALGDSDFLRLDLESIPALLSDFAPLPSAPGPTLARPTLPQPEGPPNLPNDLQVYLDQLERQILLRALTEHRFNRTAAATSLGLNLRQIRYRMARLNIQAPKDDPIGPDSQLQPI